MTKLRPTPPFSASIMFDGMKDKLLGKNSKDFVGYRIMDKHGEIQKVRTGPQKDKILKHLRDKHGRK
jgi:hypothetical protein